MLVAELGQALRQLRVERGIRQRDLATRAGLSESMLSRYESGQRLPTVKVLSEVLSALDVDFDELVFQARAQILDHAVESMEKEGPPDDPGRLHRVASLALAQSFHHLAHFFSAMSRQAVIAVAKPAGQGAEREDSTSEA